MLILAQWIVALFGAYLALGLAFALAFVTLGVTVVDPAARGMPFTARLVILPGAAALWPLLLRRWLRRQAPPVS
jgi:hypothetical protein